MALGETNVVGRRCCCRMLLLLLLLLHQVLEDGVAARTIPGWHDGQTTDCPGWQYQRMAADFRASDGNTRAAGK